MQVVPLLTALFWLAVICVLLIGAVLFLRSYRGSAVEDQQTPEVLLGKFQELHSEGGLSDAEYRTIETKLASQQQAGHQRRALKRT